MEKTDTPQPAVPRMETPVHESRDSESHRVPPPPRWSQSVALFVILSAFWFLLSGRIGLQYALFMVATVGIVMWLNPSRPFTGAHEAFQGLGFGGRLRAAVGLGRYAVWLVWNVAKANVEVAILILHPRLPVKPQLLSFRTQLEHPLAKVLVANTITLTPGTVTIDLEGDRYLVHALVPESAGAVTGGELQNIVAPIFGEGPDPVPECQWARSFRQLAP